jgi:hypothetical protein
MLDYDYGYGSFFKLCNSLWLNGNKAPDGKYKLIGSCDIKVKGGVIIKKILF